MSFEALEALFEERNRKVSTYLQDIHRGNGSAHECAFVINEQARRT